MALPVSLMRDISPPNIRDQSRTTRERDKSQSRSTRYTNELRNPNETPEQACTNSIETTAQPGPDPAAVEAGHSEVEDHLAFFTHQLQAFSRPVGHGETGTESASPRISFADYQHLYKTHNHAHGCHFVVHQHDHPIAGVHYDLRLQFSASSTVSWAIPYGLPGNPHSKRMNRLAVETRVHNLWNNLVESASHATGSLLIWDTGHYEILPRRHPKPPHHSQHSRSPSPSSSPDSPNPLPQNERLITAFQAHSIRLRLHGTRLPPNYTITLRLPRNTPVPESRTPVRRRNTTSPASLPIRKRSRRDSTPSPADSSPSNPTPCSSSSSPASLPPSPSPLSPTPSNIRATNAYPGASNTLHSIHQRHWLLRLDAEYLRSAAPPSPHSVPHTPHSQPQPQALPFPPPPLAATQQPPPQPTPFLVLGRAVERSILTGRLAEDVCADAGVRGFQGRRRWRAVLD